MGYVIGLSQIEAAITKVIAESAAASVAIVTEGAATVERVAKGNFEGAHKKGEPHVGGDKPNIVTGTLRRSIRHDPVHKDGLAGASTRVGPSVIYARRVELEYGYAFFEPAVKDTRDELREIAKRHWSKTTRA